MNRQIDKRLNELESLANLTQLPKVIVWPTEIEKEGRPYYGEAG